MNSDTDPRYAIVDPDEVADSYADSRVPGEFRRLTDALGCDQIAVTLIRVPAHSDFEQGTGHHHEEIEEVYLVTRGTLRCAFSTGSRRCALLPRCASRPGRPARIRNESDEDVEMWAISRQLGRSDSTKVEDFWKASPGASQTRA